MPTADLKQFDWARSLLVEKFKREINAYLTDELVIDRVKKKARNGDSLYEANQGINLNLRRYGVFLIDVHGRIVLQIIPAYRF
jgi:hypothetical protein